ncbi:MAG: class I SAM-dependent methyltransferase [Acidobacteria bacterium]|nr:class I SAM-dependent methyltransferase [Acidobacteriota bacterium]
MSLVFTVNHHVVERVLKKLKLSGFVSIDACFNYNNPDHLRKEVTYRDSDFLSLLGQTSEIEIVDSALDLLKETGVVSADASYSREAFINLREQIQVAFNLPSTTLSPVMERLLYMLSAVRKPACIIGLGIYYGYTLAWIAGDSCGKGKVYEARKIHAIDIDPGAVENAKTNFSKIPDTQHLDYIIEDGLIAAGRFTGSFDCLYLDVDSKEFGKGLYLELMKKFYPKLKTGGWVIAHDTIHPLFSNQLKKYLDFVRNKNYFSQSISFPVDLCGLELSIK